MIFFSIAFEKSVDTVLLNSQLFFHWKESFHKTCIACDSYFLCAWGISFPLTTPWHFQFLLYYPSTVWTQLPLESDFSASSLYFSLSFIRTHICHKVGKTVNSRTFCLAGILVPLVLSCVTWRMLIKSAVSMSSTVKQGDGTNYPIKLLVGWKGSMWVGERLGPDADTWQTPSKHSRNLTYSYCTGIYYGSFS